MHDSSSGDIGARAVGDRNDLFGLRILEWWGTSSPPPPSSGNSAAGGDSSSAGGSGGSSSSGSGSSGSDSGALAALAADPCSLFTTAPASTVAGNTVAAGKKDSSGPGRCAWAGGATGASVAVNVRATILPDFSGEVKEAPDSYQHTSPKIGHDSVWYSINPDSKGVLALLVIDGGMRLQVDVTSASDLDLTALKARLLPLVMAKI